MFLYLRRLFIVCAHRLKAFLVFLSFLFSAKFRHEFGRGASKVDKKIFYRSQPKPQWVKHEIMKLKALMPQAGCRTIADTFNRIFHCKDMSVGKSFVHSVFKKYDYQIQVLRRKIKNTRPRPVPRNLIWGMDLTGKTDIQGNSHYILGMVEYKSRGSLCLTALKDKSIITLLRHLLNVLEYFGKPRILRTDNEPVFVSYLLRTFLRLLGIKHQPIQPGCPWQNGRIERFFGTLKEKLNQWQVDGKEQLNNALGQFNFWYNHVRPHQNLDGRTPAEVWKGVDVFSQRPKKEYWFEAWDGLLTGIYLRL